ncbi:MAG: PAS domain-containing protein [Cytophagaceae bacterium]|nr:MAG: PAS domain-containing protein [Cytophagaceae bacterium]
MSASTQLPAQQPGPDALLRALLDTSRTGIVHFRPLYAAGRPGELIDLAYERLNPAAQHLLGLPEYPAETFLTLAPHDGATFAFYCAAFQTGETSHYDWPAAGPGGRLHVVAQRSGLLLAASLTAATAAPTEAAPAPEIALFRQVFEQAPAAMCLLQEPTHQFEYVNSAFAQLFAGRQLLGRPVVAALPEILPQGIMAQLDRLYAQDERFFGQEVRLIGEPTGEEPANVRYLDFIYQAHRVPGQPARLAIFASDVTAQVLARQQQASQWAEWQRLFEQVPVAVLRGPQHLIERANPAMCALWGYSPAQVLGRPLFEVLPEANTPTLAPQLAQVLATGIPLATHELLSRYATPGQPGTTHLDFGYHLLPEADGRAASIVLVVNKADEQLRSYWQAQEINDVQILNEELHTANEELRANNDELMHAQHQLWELNQELETRVAAGIAAAQLARDRAEQQRQRLASFFQQVPAAIGILDGPAMVCELVNTDFQRLLPGRRLLGLPLLEALPELAGTLAWHTLQQVYATGETHEEIGIRVALARHEGAPLQDFYLHYVQQARYNEHGRIDGVLLFILNITEQILAHQRAEILRAAALAATQRQAQERETFYQVFEQTPAVVALMWGPEHRFEYYNKSFEKLFPGQELRGRTLAEAMPEARERGFLALLDGVYQTGQPQSYSEVPLPLAQPARPSAPTAYFDFMYQAYREHGQTRGVSVFAYEVTAQVLARQRRETQQRELEQLFMQAPAPIMILDGPELVCQLVNPAYQRIFPGRVLAGRPFLEALPELADTPIPSLFRQVMQTGEPYQAQEMPLQMARHEGGPPETIYFTFTYQPRRNDQGEVAGIWVFAHDVSEHVRDRQAVLESAEQAKELAQSLMKTNEQLTRTNTDLDTFIYTASHDLKAPIANIEGLLLLLRKQLPAEVRQAGMVPRVLGMMQGAIERFQLTIAQLTDLAKLQHAHAQPAEEVDLRAVVEAVRLDLLPLLEATHTQLTIDLDGCTVVSFAPQHLRSLLYNLLSNAIKYHYPGRQPLVQLRCRHHEGTTSLEVEDNGLGLSPDQQSKVFGMFRRLHAHVEGSGVGLYMVKRMVENAGGRISVQSRPEIGSTFTVSFPT